MAETKCEQIDTFRFSSDSAKGIYCFYFFLSLLEKGQGTGSKVGIAPEKDRTGTVPRSLSRCTQIDSKHS